MRMGDPNVKLQMDITQIDQADETYDVIYCSHVLEHVNNDRRATSEFYRVLKAKRDIAACSPAVA